MRRAAVLLAALALLGGCDDEEAEREPEPLPPPVQRGAEYEQRVIRGWLLALNRDDYTGAADYFAIGAIIDQGDPFRLPSPAAARIFNAGLPCRADLAGVEDEPGPKSLASFRLRRGPGGPCSGIVKVRFTIRKGKFTEWRQLPEEPEPPGPVVLDPPAGLNVHARVSGPSRAQRPQERRWPRRARSDTGRCCES